MTAQSNSCACHPIAQAAWLAALIISAPALAQIWSEEFDAGPNLDPAIWTHDLGDSGWGNHELQNYTNELTNTRVEDGRLVMTAIRAGDGITSGRIKTKNKLTFRYGRLEARIKAPDLDAGLWPAFWALGQNIDEVGWPHCGEIDLLEMGKSSALRDGVVNQRVFSGFHWHTGEHAAVSFSHLDSPPDEEGFRIHSVEWTPEMITTKVNGQIVHRIDISDVDTNPGLQAFHRPKFILVNLAVGGNYTGIHNPDVITAPLPAEYAVDWIRLYDNGHTLLGGSAIEGHDADNTGLGPSKEKDPDSGEADN